MLVPGCISILILLTVWTWDGSTGFRQGHHTIGLIFKTHLVLLIKDFNPMETMQIIGISILVRASQLLITGL
jgi:hypothetical protein